MAPTTKDCQAMIEAACKHNRKLMIAYRLHFEKANLEAIHIGRRGKLGELRFFSSDFAQQVVKENVRLTEPVSKAEDRSMTWAFNFAADQSYYLCDLGAQH